MEFIRKGTRQKVIAYSEIQPNDNVLDVCTGTGELAIAFARAGATVTGIDIAEDMLKRAGEKFNGTSLSWHRMDACHLAFDRHSFDVSAISLALHHMPEVVQHQVLSELARVTRRKIIIVEPHQPFAAWKHTAWALIATIIDESEYMFEWARQDFNRVCAQAGLAVEHVEVTTLAIHRITVCRPV